MLSVTDQLAMIRSQMLVYNLGLAMATALNLTHVHTPLLSHAGRGDHADLEGGADELEALLGSAPGLVAKFITEITPRIAPL